MFRRLWVKQFRNLKECVFDFKDSTEVFIYGRNNQGKSNFLEALYYLGNASSPFDTDHAHLVQFDCNDAVIGADIGVVNKSLFKIYFKIQSNGNRSGVLDGKLIKQFRKLRQCLSVEFLSADVIRIFQDYSEHRRKDLDRFLNGFFLEYANIEKSYSRVLRHKNQVLKKGKGDTEVTLWNKQLVSLAYPLLKYRLKGLNIILEHLQPLLTSFNSQFKDALSLNYIPKGLDSWSGDIKGYSDSLYKAMVKNMDKERHIGYSLVGPHRDDYSIFIKNRDLFNFFSRGINRSVAILLKLAQLIALKEKCNVFPVLLLDDTFSEIDRSNKEKLLTIIKPLTQLFYVSVDQDDACFFSNKIVWSMEDGNIKYG